MADETPTPTETPTTEAAPEGQTVPYERFAAKIAEIKTLQDQLTEAKSLIENVKALETQIKSIQDERTADASKFAQTEALLRAGILDDDIAELARWRFDKSESDNFAEWLANDAAADAILGEHLKKGAAPEAPTQPAPQPTPQPSPNNGVRNTPAPRGEFSPEAVQKMSVDDLKANYAKIASAWGYVPRNLK